MVKCLPSLLLRPSILLAAAAALMTLLGPSYLRDAYI